MQILSTLLATFQEVATIDGVYVSIEYSDTYGGFAKGYYLVMIASGKYAKLVLDDVKKHVSDAYVKRSSVYMGCMH